MRSSARFLAGLVVLTSIALAAPNVKAHNLSKYTNVPFVLPASCSGATSAWVTSNGTLALQLSSGSSSDYTGFQIFNSVPTSNSNTASSASGFVPAGSYSFNVSGNANGAVVDLASVASPGSSYSTISTGNAATGTVTFTVASGQNMVEGYVYGAAFSNVMLTNFRQNNVPILSDTTQVATSTASNYFNFCY